MRAIDRTAFLFVCSVRDALPGAHISVQRSDLPHGRSRYVYITLEPGQWPLKVRISDHGVGMRRAMSGTESLYLHHLAKPAHWAVWLSELAAFAARRNPAAAAAIETGPLFVAGRQRGASLR